MYILFFLLSFFINSYGNGIAAEKTGNAVLPCDINFFWTMHQTKQVLANMLVVEHGQTLITAYARGVIKYWRVKDGSCKRILSWGQEEIVSLALAKVDDLEVLVAASEDGNIGLWNGATGDSLGIIRTGKCKVRAMTCVGSSVVTGHLNGAVRVWDINSKKARYTLSGHKKAVNVLVPLQMKGTAYIASASSDQTIRIWDLERGICVGVLRGHTKEIERLVCLRGKHTDALVSWSEDHTLKVWHPDKGVCVRTYGIKKGDFKVLVPCNEGRSIFIVDYDSGMVNTYNIVTGEYKKLLIKRIALHGQEIRTSVNLFYKAIDVLYTCEGAIMVQDIDGGLKSFELKLLQS